MKRPLHMSVYDNQAYSLLEELYRNLTGQYTEVHNIGDYINVFTDLKGYYNNDTDFFNAVYNDITLKMSNIIWECAEVENPYSYLQTDVANIRALAKRGYVCTRELNADDVTDKYFVAPKENDYGMDEEELTRMEKMRWKGKDLPTFVRGTTGNAKYYDSLNFYRRWLEGAMYEPYEFYNMYATIKRAWMNALDTKVGTWNMNTMFNLITSTYKTKTLNVRSGQMVESRQIHLLTEYNAKFGKALTPANWFKPENIKEFAPWLYIRINEIKALMKRLNELYMCDNVTEFRGNYYRYEYQLNDNELATLFIREPWLYMKSYSNAEVYNENDLEKADVHYTDYWMNPLDKYTFKVHGFIVPEPDEENPIEFVYNKKEDELITIPNLFGIIYDKNAIGTAVYDRREYQTPLNEATEHGVIHIHGNLTNFYNAMLKAVVLCLD